MKPQEKIIGEIIGQAKRMHPRDFQAFLFGIVGTVVGSMSERYWTEFKIVDPCGRPGCDCHVMTAKVMPVMHILRHDFREKSRMTGGN